jgi:hypothetical protein
MLYADSAFTAAIRLIPMLSSGSELFLFCQAKNHSIQIYDSKKSLNCVTFPEVVSPQKNSRNKNAGSKAR